MGEHRNKKIHEGMNGFGTYGRIKTNRSIKGYVALATIAVAISVGLVIVLMTSPKPVIPPKKAVFSPEQQTAGDVFDKIKAKVKETVMAGPKVQTGMGITNLVTGKKDAAIENFNKVIEANPENPVGYLQRGAAYLTKGDLKLGTKDIEMAATLNPEYAPIAQKCRMIQNLFKNSQVPMSEGQIRGLMASMTQKDINRITAQMMKPGTDEANTADPEK